MWGNQILNKWAMLRDCITREHNLEQGVKEDASEEVKLMEEVNWKLKFEGRIGTVQRESGVEVEPRTEILSRGISMF